MRTPCRRAASYGAGPGRSGSPRVEMPSSPPRSKSILVKGSWLGRPRADRQHDILPARRQTQFLEALADFNLQLVQGLGRQSAPLHDVVCDLCASATERHDPHAVGLVPEEPQRKTPQSSLAGLDEVIEVLFVKVEVPLLGDAAQQVLDVVLHWRRIFDAVRYVGRVLFGAGRQQRPGKGGDGPEKGRSHLICLHRARYATGSPSSRSAWQRPGSACGACPCRWPGRRSRTPCRPGPSGWSGGRP